MSGERDPAPPQRSLPLEINAATQTQHSALNRLIRSRLPLCLPPHAQTPQLYAIGLSVFGSIYMSFEDEWRRVLARRRKDNPRMAEILQTIRLPKLLRRHPLERELVDLQCFIGKLPTSKIAFDALGAHQTAMRTSIHAKPHILLAYAWVMYMALFNGGHIIRDQLVAAGPKFWHTSNTPADFEEGAYLILAERLQFWYFDSPNDGDDIKEDFKQRFDIAAAQLTASERADVVDEAVRIFAVCHTMVDWLDENANTQLASDVDLETISIRRYERSAAMALLFFMWDYACTFLALIFCSSSSGATQRSVQVKKTVGTPLGSHSSGRS